MKISKNYLFLGLLSLSLVLVVLACKKDDAEDLIGNWLEQSDYEGFARYDAVAFTIGNIGYVGTGYDGDDRLSDFWSYDPDKNNWVQIKDFEGEPRNSAVAFTAAEKGYVGTGYNGEDRLNDFWVYDPVTNDWDTVAAQNDGFGPTARYGAVAFSIDNIGYVATGYDGNNLKDLWAFSPATNSWVQKTSFQTKVRDAVAFVIDGKGYICTGYNNEYIKDFYMYDPTNDSWTPKSKIADVSDESFDDGYTIVREKAVAFLVGSKAYIATGSMSSASKNDVWEYDASTDLWTARTGFEGEPRKDAVAFSTESGRGFVTTGWAGSTVFDDTWEFKPEDVYNDED